MACYTYDGCCGSCIYMNTNDYCRHKDNCYCTLRKQYYDLKEPQCSYYKYDKNKDYYDLNHRWHVVSAIFAKLNLKDSYECISILHNFRINYLEKDEKYSIILQEYDHIGPMLAKCLMEDNDSEELCKDLIQLYLVKVLDHIKAKEEELALAKFLEMIYMLSLIYNNEIMDYEKLKRSGK